MLVTTEQLTAIGDLLREEYHAQRVILFGSVANGTAGPDSDIDILVTADTAERYHVRMATVRTLVHERWSRLPVSPIVLTPAELAKRIQIGDQFVQQILATGVDI